MIFRPPLRNFVNFFLQWQIPPPSTGLLPTKTKTVYKLYNFDSPFQEE